MAKSPNGPYGHPVGKIGSLVHYMLKGQHIVRIVGAPPKHRSLKQKVNQQAMAVTMNLLRPMLYFINASFDIEAAGTTKNPHNLAVSYNKKNALQGEFPNLSIDYSKVVLSKGSLDAAEDLKLEKTAQGLEISWNSEVKGNLATQEDAVMIMVYMPRLGIAHSELNAAKRMAGKYLVAFDASLLTEPMEVYVCFKSAGGKHISDSIYLGNLNGAVETKAEKKTKEKKQQLADRFERVSADYQKVLTLHAGNPPNTRAFRKLKTQYMALMRKLGAG